MVAILARVYVHCGLRGTAMIDLEEVYYSLAGGLPVLVHKDGTLLTSEERDELLEVLFKDAR